MPHAVFLRAANVGGRNVFRPARLVEALEHLGLVNLGAAGTFVVRERLSAAEVRREILAQLPFEPDLVIVPAREVLALVRREPFRGEAFSKDRRGWAAALCAKPKSNPALPLSAPSGKEWSVRIEGIEGSFVLGIHQRRAKPIFPNQVVEKALGVPSTTRWWETIVKLAEIIEK